ncbi:MAG TPA: FadR family transcriptional regulator [Ruminococcaceae bacterium]|nr:FadR family transcriptional regulator [Ruminiclostridium sp.]HCA29394.1 FadR family transcriptional regulator [Oscillospiraceae bacterium]
MFEAVVGNEGSLAERVADSVLQLIIDQNLTCGEKLPNEFELAGKLHVGRGTVREAVKLLVSRNVLEIRRGKGTFVTEKPGVASDPLGLAFFRDKYKLASDLIEIRLILEPQIAAFAAQYAQECEIQRMQELSAEVERLATENIDYSDIDIELHTCIAQSTRNLVMPNLIPIITSGISIYNTFPRHSERMNAIYVHREIIDAIAKHNTNKASDAMHKHLIYNRRNLEEIKNKFDSDIKQSDKF